VALVGGHDSGKTSILVELVPRLKAKGLVVGTIKHTTRDVDDDTAGKDSQRHAAAGAAVAVLVTPGRTTARRFGDEEGFEEVLRREFGGCDLVLIEGYKSLSVPKIEVIRTGISRPDVVEPIARISDGPFQGSVPTLSFGDWDAIVATVLRAAGLDRENRESGNGSRKTA
jgi:molybdopterin-guanine dinucleotide biosynthesis protein B